MNNMKLDYKNYIIGGITGAFVGVLAAFLIERTADLDEEGWESTKKKLSKMGFKTLSMLWSLTDQGKGRHH